MVRDFLLDLPTGSVICLAARPPMPDANELVRLPQEHHLQCPGIHLNFIPQQQQQRQQQQQQRQQQQQPCLLKPEDRGVSERTPPKGHFHFHTPGSVFLGSNTDPHKVFGRLGKN